MKGFKKALAAALTVTAIMASWIVPVFAAPFTYQGIPGTTTKLTKYFIVNENVTLPDVTFAYDLDPIDAADVIDATGTTMAVVQGVDGATVADVTFDSDSDTYTTVQTGDTLTLPAGMKYAKADITLDFQNCTFTEPGVYRYILKEQQCSNGAVVCDTTEKYVDVFVEDKNTTTDSGTLTLTGYTIHTSDDAPANTASTLSDKIDSIINSYETTDLYVGKKVTGNQGSRDKYFKFDIEITDLPAGVELAIDLTNASPSVGDNDATVYASGTDNPTSMTADTDGKAAATVYLQNDEYVIIRGLTADSSYKVTEEAEDYTSTDSETTAFTIGSVSFNSKTVDKITDTDNDGTISDEVYAAGFTNNRAGVVPTGIITKIAPIAIVGVIAAAGIVILVIRNTKRKAEEEA